MTTPMSELTPPLPVPDPPAPYPIIDWRFGPYYPHNPTSIVDFGYVHVGDHLIQQNDQGYTVTNIAPPGYPTLDVRVLTHSNGGHITDPSLTGEGVSDGVTLAIPTPPLPSDQLGVSRHYFFIDWNPVKAGALTDQFVRVETLNAPLVGGTTDAAGYSGDTIQITGTALNYAQAAFVNEGGGPRITQTGADSWQLDLGDIVQGSKAHTYTEAIANIAKGPADAMAGDLLANMGTGGIALGGLAHFNGIVAGKDGGDFTVTADTSAVGQHSASVKLTSVVGYHPGYFGQVSGGTLTITDNVVAGHGHFAKQGCG